MKKVVAVLGVLLMACSVATAAPNAPEVRIITIAPTVDTNAYAAKDSIGGVQTLSKAVCPNTNVIEIVAAQIIDLSGNAVEYSLVFFKASPSGTFTDNANIDPADTTAGIKKLLPVLNLAANDHFAFADNGTSSLNSLHHILWVDSASGSAQDLYMVVMASGATTFADDEDLTINLAIRCL